VYLLESGLLSVAPHPPIGVPYLGRYVREACGEQTLRDTIIAISGATPDPNQAVARQIADLFVIRGGRPLLYFSYP
jgi:hypothetical protein